MSKRIIDKLDIVIKMTLSCWRNLRSSTIMAKIHGIKYHLLNQSKGIGYFITDFIKQAHQFGIIDEKRIDNMRDRVKASIYHSKMESILLSCEVESKIEQITINTRRTHNKRIRINVK